jgi:hypothetical protein
LAIGLALGLAGALAVARLLTGFLYGISPWDVGTYLGTIAVLGSAALLATLLPAIRAATITARASSRPTTRCRPVRRPSTRRSCTLTMDRTTKTLRDRVLDHLAILRIPITAEELDHGLDSAEREGLATLEALDRLLGEPRGRAAGDGDARSTRRRRTRPQDQGAVLSGQPAWRQRDALTASRSAHHATATLDQSRPPNWTSPEPAATLHSQISLTLNTYAHVVAALQRDAAAKMDRILSGRV